jgi:hypothetical protein
MLFHNLPSLPEGWTVVGEVASYRLPILPGGPGIYPGSYMDFEYSVARNASGEEAGILVARAPGAVAELVGLYPRPDIDPKLRAYDWLAHWRAPLAPQRPRRGLLWHVLDAAHRWFSEGY